MIMNNSPLFTLRLKQTLSVVNGGLLYHKDKMNCGIYKIVNKINGNIYIGSSQDISRRWNKHILWLAKNKHENRHLQRAWNLYGQSAFSFSIIEECPVELLVEREQYFINEFCPNYNILKKARNQEGAINGRKPFLVCQKCDNEHGYLSGWKMRCKGWADKVKAGWDMKKWHESIPMIVKDQFE